MNTPSGKPAGPTRRTPTPRHGGLEGIASASAAVTQRQRAILFVAALAVLAALVTVASVLGAAAESNAPATDADAADDPATQAQGPEAARVSFVAVGDNLPDDEIGWWADAQSGEEGDGTYDYHAIYEPVKPYVEAADLAYVKQETHLGGNDIGPKGWPSFNVTDEMADAVVDTGFDLVGSASNHSYDWGYFGANDHSREVWNSKPVVFAGTASSEAEAAAIATIERNGITFALLDYTYGVNGYDRSELPSYEVSYIDDERIASDVAAAKEAADVVLVAMHWGTENQTDPDDEQLRLAKLLADLEVDVVLGSHPHVIGPLSWVEGESGHKTLVAYSLGDFMSNHDEPLPLNELEGMLTCDFVRDAGSTEVRVENVRWVPLVNHTVQAQEASDDAEAVAEEHAVYALKDYTAELAAAHVAFGELDDPLSWLLQKSSEVVNSAGDDFPVEGWNPDMAPTSNDDDGEANDSTADGTTAAAAGEE